MSNPRSTYSKVGKRKKAMSSRKTIGSKDINYEKRASLIVSYPEKFRDVDGEQRVRRKDVLLLGDPKVTTSYEPHAVAWGSRTRNTSNTIRKVKPKNRDFRPFLWRGPKPYERVQGECKVVNSKLSRLTTIVSSIDPSTASLEGQSKLRYVRPLVTTKASFSDKQLHYLRFNEELADQKVDVLTTLAEAKSTVTMVADAAHSLFSFYRAVRKADIKSIKRLLRKKNIKRSVSKGWRNKTAESRWLELQYGWQPFAADIKIAFEELLEDKRPPAPIIKVTKSSILDADKYVNTDRYDYYNFFGILKTSCYYTVTSEGIRDAAKWNLGVNPLLTGWELVPYSFVVDWFLPIGDFLAQYSASKGLEYISGTTVSHIKFDGQLTSEVLVSNGGVNATIETTEHHQVFRTLREVNYSSPIGLPVFDGGLSVGRALNALALISQRR